MSKLNAFIISACLLLAALIFIVTRNIFGNVNRDFLINLCAGILTVGFTVFLVDVTRENALKKRVKQMLPIVCEEIQTSSNSLLSLIALRINRGDKKLINKIYDIRDRAAWSEATEVLLDHVIRIDKVGAAYSTNFDTEYMEVLYKAAKLEEKNLFGIYSRYPAVLEDPDFAKTFADLTKGVRQIVWAYEEISDQSKAFILSYGKDRGLKTTDTSEVIRYHMSFPMKLFVGNYYIFVMQFSSDLGLPKDWSL